MMKNSPIIISVVVLFLSVKTFGQNKPDNPCPQLFQYLNDGVEWYGFMELPSPVLGQTLKINLVLSLRDRLPANYPGALELFGTRDQALMRIYDNKPVQYKVKFPLIAPLPKITQILYNNRIICSGPTEQGPVVTTIKLEHIFYTQLVGEHLSRDPFVTNFDNPLGQQDQMFSYPQGQSVQVPGSLPSFQQNPSLQSPGSFSNVQSNNNQNDFNSLQRPQFQQNTPRPQQQVKPRPQKQPISRPQQQITASVPPQKDTPQNDNEICGRPDNRFGVTPLVVGGTEIRRGTWPWLVAIYLNIASALQFQCGGTLVSARVVVTAAHCFHLVNKKYTEKDIILYLGRHNIRVWDEQGSMVATGKSVNVHPDYKDDLMSFDADIAVVVLEKKVRYTEYIRPVCLWSESDDVREPENLKGVVVGWGKDESGQITTPEPKRVEVEIVSETTCLRSSDRFRLLTSNRTFCAGNKDGTGPCKGDSGAGLMVNHNNRWKLRGSVSASLADTKFTCNLEEYVIYVDVAKFLSWIKSFL